MRFCGPRFSRGDGESTALRTRSPTPPTIFKEKSQGQIPKDAIKPRSGPGCLALQPPLAKSGRKGRRFTCRIAATRPKARERVTRRLQRQASGAFSAGRRERDANGPRRRATAFRRPRNKKGVTWGHAWIACLMSRLHFLRAMSWAEDRKTFPFNRAVREETPFGAIPNP